MEYNIVVNGGLEYKDYESENRIEQEYHTCPKLCRNHGVCSQDTYCECWDSYAGQDCGVKINHVDVQDDFGYGKFSIQGGKYFFISLPRSGLVKGSSQIVLNLQENYNLKDDGSSLLKAFFSVKDSLILPTEGLNDHVLNLNQTLIEFKPASAITQFFDHASEKIYIGKKFKFLNLLKDF